MPVTHQFPPPQLPIGERPGERMVAGQPYVFSLDLLNAYLADRAIAEAPADLSQLTWDHLSSLFGAYLNRRSRFPNDEAAQLFGQRVCAERTRRPEYAAFRKECA